jgi:N-acyl-phosphatidylethanolamine-hydrolysing phospholipase D
MPRPAHHGPDGRYRNPWPLGADPPPGGMAGLRWVWERLRYGVAPDPPPRAIPLGTPVPARPRIRPAGLSATTAGGSSGDTVAAELPAPAAGVSELRVTWIGHMTFLVQLPGLNILTDPVFSHRASPFRWAGPRRFHPPALTVDALPPVDVVLISHDHYDHLDASSVRRLRARFGDDLAWFAPLGYAAFFARCGVRRLIELDWWEAASHAIAPGPATGIAALPARHWTRRGLGDTRRRLWCSWALTTPDARLYFCGDSGYGPGFAEIGNRLGPFDVALLPIGAYEPRWFMASAHMNPEEAARAAIDLRARDVIGGHWGTFRLTDEDPLEPPIRMRATWRGLDLPPDRLHIPGIGGTVRIPVGRGPAG